LEDSGSYEERDRKAQTLLGVLSAQGVSEKVLKDQLVAVLVGGRVRSKDSLNIVNTNAWLQDSVAIAVTWTLYELVCHPDILRELRTELSAL
jgi:hypothetical protein